jgi:hypothetical protein
LITQLHYEPYFLTVYDLVVFARGRGILCQGRGSAANSAVCYCLGVTSVDPSRIDLLFERFVSSARGEPPDIDRKPPFHLVTHARLSPSLQHRTRATRPGEQLVDSNFRVGWAASRYMIGISAGRGRGLAYRTSSPVTVRPISMRWISDVPSKIVKILAIGAVFAGQWPEYPRGISTDSARPTRDERRRPADLGAVPDALRR